MPVVSAKRQITLPIEHCRQAGIKPGDTVRSYVDNAGQISIIKLRAGAASGLLKQHPRNVNVSDEESLLDGMQQ